VLSLAIVIIVVIAASGGGGGGGGGGPPACNRTTGSVVLFCDDIFGCNASAHELGAQTLIGEWNAVQYHFALATGLYVGVSPAIGSHSVGFDGKGTSKALFYPRLQDTSVSSLVSTDVNKTDGVFQYHIEISELGRQAEQGPHPERLFFAQDVEYQVVAESSANAMSQMYAQWAALMAIARAYVSPQTMGVWPVVSASMVKSLRWDGAAVLAAFNSLRLVDDTLRGNGRLIIAREQEYSSWTEFCHANGWIDGFISQGYGNSGCLTNEAKANLGLYGEDVPFVTMITCDNEIDSSLSFVVHDDVQQAASCKAPFDRGLYLSSMAACSASTVRKIQAAPSVLYSGDYSGPCV